MKKTLILMLLCGVASAEMEIPGQCFIFLSNNGINAIQSGNCGGLKENCINELKNKRDEANSIHHNTEYQQYGVLLDRVKLVDCNKQ